MKSKLINIFTSVRTLIILASIVPLLFTGLTISYNSIRSRIKDNLAVLRYKGIQYSRHIAAASEYGLFSGDLSYLDGIIKSQFDDRDVYSIAVYSSDAKLISKYYTPYASGTPPGTTGKIIRFRQPVYPSNLDLDSADSPGSATNTGSNSSPVDPAIMGWVELALSTRPFQRKQSAMISQEVVITTIIVCISALVAVLIGAMIIKPIKRLRKVSQEMRDGNLSTRIENFSVGEFRELESAFNEMAAHISNSQENLKEKINLSTRQLKETINELIDRNNELEQARLEAQHANDIKGKFLANMSHEIRTPINAIIGFIRLLNKTGPDKEQLEYIHVLEQSSVHLLSLINNILDIARIESEAFKIKHDAFDLYELLEETMKMLSSIAHRKGLELALNIETDTPRIVISDAYHLKQVLINLVNNAIKFTSSGYVSVNVSRSSTAEHECRIHFEVSDTGIGMTSDQIEKIYEPFYQADNSYSRMYEGTGLGLTIVKSIVTEMKGQYGVNSSPGKGTVFWFHIPTDEIQDEAGTAVSHPDNLHILICDPQPVSLRSIHSLFARKTEYISDVFHYDDLIDLLTGNGSEQNIDILVIGADVETSISYEFEEVVVRICELYKGPILILAGNEHYQIPPGVEGRYNLAWLTKPTTEMLLWNALSELIDTSRAAPCNEITAANDNDMLYRNKHLLLAEDNEFNRLLITAILEHTGIHISVANNGREAITLASKRAFDVILMDIHLPTLNGIEVSSLVRRTNGPNVNTPIIAMTADVFAAKNRNVIDSGINHVLIKPFDEDQFWEVIHDAIAEGGYRHNSSRPARSPGPNKSIASITARLLPKYYKQLPVAIDNINQAVSENSIEKLRETLHHLKGATDYLQMTDISEAIREAEESVNTLTASDSDGLESLVHKLVAMLDMQLQSHVNEAESNRR